MAAPNTASVMRCTRVRYCSGVCRTQNPTPHCTTYNATRAAPHNYANGSKLGHRLRPVNRPKITLCDRSEPWVSIKRYASTPTTIDAPAGNVHDQSPRVSQGPDANAPTPSCKLRCRSKAAELPVSFAYRTTSAPE